MTQKRQSLFRQAVLEEQSSTGLGEVLIVVPPRARYLVIGTGAVTILTCLFLCFVSFSRSETVSGSLHIASRPVQVLIPGPGTVEQILVTDGVKVIPGDLLAVINTGTIMEGGQSLQAVQLAALDKARDAIQERKKRLESRLSRRDNAVQSIEDALSELDIRLAELEVQRAKIQSSRQVELRAPIAGRVAHVKYTAGDSVLAGDRMLVLAPESTAMNAELYVSVDSLPLIKENQPVSLGLDSSVSTQFDAFEGQVESISEGLIPQDELKQLGLGYAAHLVKIRVQPEVIESIRSRFPSVHSLSLKANLPLPRRRLWDWIVEPMNKSNRSQDSYESQ